MAALRGGNEITGLCQLLTVPFGKLHWWPSFGKARL